jgi:hypothetical protein
MVSAVPLRQQGLDRLTQQFASLVAEQVLGLGVHKNNEAARIDDHDGVRGGLEQRAETLLQSATLVHLSREVVEDVQHRLLHFFEALLLSAGVLQNVEHRPLCIVKVRSFVGGIFKDIEDGLRVVG